VKSREHILQDLIGINGNTDILKIELSQFSWDSEKELVTVNNEDLINAITKCISDNITLDELVRWANIIECRDDIGFIHEATKEFTHEIANATINGLNKSRLEDILNDLTIP
jgi:hypothetical protein